MGSTTVKLKDAYSKQYEDCEDIDYQARSLNKSKLKGPVPEPDRIIQSKQNHKSYGTDWHYWKEYEQRMRTAKVKQSDFVERDYTWLKKSVVILVGFGIFGGIFNVEKSEPAEAT